MLTSTSPSRWVAAKPNRYEYARLAQRRPPSPERRQWKWRLQSIGRSHVLHAELNRLRLQSATAAGPAPAFAEWQRTQWLSSVSQPSISDPTPHTIETSATSGRQCCGITAPSAWRATHYAFADAAAGRLPRSSGLSQWGATIPGIYALPAVPESQQHRESVTSHAEPNV